MQFHQTLFFSSDIQEDSPTEKHLGTTLKTLLDQLETNGAAWELLGDYY